MKSYRSNQTEQADKHALTSTSHTYSRMTTRPDWRGSPWTSWLVCARAHTCRRAHEQLAHTWLRCLVLSRHTRKSLELITPFESCANNLSSYKCFRYTSTFLARADFRLSSHLRFHLVILMHHPCPSHHIAAAAETPLDDEAEGACVYA